MKITVRDSTLDDIYDIQDIARITWLDTYPNQQENITTDDVQSVFKDSDTSAGRERLLKKKKKGLQESRYSFLGSRKRQLNHRILLSSQGKR